MQPAEPPDAWSVSVGPIIYFAFVERGGPVFGPLSGLAAVFKHAALSGRAQIVERSREVLALVAEAKNAADLSAALRAKGFDVQKTRAAQLRWALTDVWP